MLDSDLAKLYQVTTGNLNKSVKRNLDEFPKDFIFEINLSEKQKINTLFYDGQIYDAYSLFMEILDKAKEEIIIIDIMQVKSC